jgi:hypothetical protein
MRNVKKLGTMVVLLAIGFYFGRQMLDYCTMGLLGIHVASNELVTIALILFGASVLIPGSIIVYAIHAAGVGFPFVHAFHL